MNFTPNNPFSNRPPLNPPPPIVPPPPPPRRLDGLEEGDPIFVQTPAGVCEQGVFLRIEDGFLIWVRQFNDSAYITISSLNEISITRL